MAKETLITGIQSGRVFARIEAIGAGQFGRVYSVMDMNNGVMYAMKLPAESINGSHHGDILTREARYQESFSHPHITRVELFDSTRDVSSAGELPFLVTPLAKTTLQRRIVQSPPTIQEAVLIGENTADALDVIHKRGLVYVDLKPANVLLNSDHDGMTAAELTDFGAVTTPDTMTIYPSEPQSRVLPPEYYYEEKYTFRSEQFVWAAGIVYPTVTGESPYAEDPLLLMSVGRFPERRSFTSLMPPGSMTGLHEALEEVTAKALQECQEERYSSMAELTNDLKTKRVKVDERERKQRRTL